MKKHIPLLVALAALAGCETIYLPTLKEVPVNPTNTRVADIPAADYRLAASHWTDVAKLRDEATRLVSQVSQGKLTKVQAAQLLNRFRIQLVGRNSVDDAVYDVYLRSAIDSQRGVISSEQSKTQIQSTLRGWQQRWKNMDSKPNNPAFTNFLLEYMNMTPLK
ncbi:prokaryotic membrane lipolipid attachment site family protein [Neisseria animalis]|uniref:Prokaryotic membrane lipolipid attachment site family protein n=1 Tax=Neisseria animalis TaxID=492 RepID=A0A5P3MPV5_NEIAN|nr:prokaryotic membrane lipolipid attachment site family protein [Neisseria animalis]QEY23586.1 prokaryotic membrane lipolipid attachment site family protein [Neisseria animalis]ROW32731.1 prokaryotic membrane lipolipid attachment site family protein [Neisseria animalis]VEE09276.1 lipoprotein [Neisseria animalis]